MVTLVSFPGSDPAEAAIGARLRRWREARGVAIEDLAGALGISPEHGRRVEAGRAHLDSVQIGTALRALRLPLWALQSDTRAG